MKIHFPSFLYHSSMAERLQRLLLLLMLPRVMLALTAQNRKEITSWRHRLCSVLPALHSAVTNRPVDGWTGPAMENPFG
uniref:Putative secreted protein n=1 Tax=Anopheles darlingi TaxID=43151 RepID=A0A2M4DGU6_ANODA